MKVMNMQFHYNMLNALSLPPAAAATCNIMLQLQEAVKKRCSPRRVSKINWKF